MNGFQLVGQFLCHAAKGSTSQRFHDDTLYARLLTFLIKILSIGIVAPAFLYGGMSPVKEVHLNLHEVPVILLLTVEQPVEVAHVAVVGETKVLDASSLTLLEQEIENAVVEETSLERVHAAADAVKEVVVDMIHLQPFQRLLVHAFRCIETPRTAVLV